MDEYDLLKREIARLEGQIAGLRAIVTATAYELPDRALRIVGRLTQSGLDDAEAEASRREIGAVGDFRDGFYEIVADFPSSIEEHVWERRQGSRLKTIQPHPEGEAEPWPPGILPDDED